MSKLNDPQITEETDPSGRYIKVCLFLVCFWLMCIHIRTIYSLAFWKADILFKFSTSLCSLWQRQGDWSVLESMQLKNHVWKRSEHFSSRGFFITSLEFFLFYLLLSFKIDTMKMGYHSNIIDLLDYWVVQEKCQLIYICEISSAGTLREFVFASLYVFGCVHFF